MAKAQAAAFQAINSLSTADGHLDVEAGGVELESRLVIRQLRQVELLRL